jgi:hypothetical protein
VQLVALMDQGLQQRRRRLQWCERGTSRPARADRRLLFHNDLPRHPGVW